MFRLIVQTGMKVNGQKKSFGLSNMSRLLLGGRSLWYEWGAEASLNTTRRRSQSYLTPWWFLFVTMGCCFHKPTEQMVWWRTVKLSECEQCFSFHASCILKEVDVLGDLGKQLPVSRAYSRTCPILSSRHLKVSLSVLSHCCAAAVSQPEPPHPVWGRTSSPQWMKLRSPQVHT